MRSSRSSSASSLPENPPTETPPCIRSTSSATLLPQLIADTQARGLPAQRYIGEIKSLAQPVTHGDLTARTFRNKAGLRGALPPELARQVWGASLKGTTLTALVHTAAWGTRLRYVASKLTAPVAAALGAPVEEIKVKVRAEPRRGQTP